MKRIVSIFLVIIGMMACRHNVISYQEAEGYKLVCQTKGPTLDAYEDWRLPAGERGLARVVRRLRCRDATLRAFPEGRLLRSSLQHSE